MSDATGEGGAGEAGPGGLGAQGTSTRPYLIRALHDWCTDNGYTPYIAVYVDDGVRVPKEYVKNQEIVLNVGFEATSGLKLGNEWIEFKARFGGSSRDISVPVDHVIAIYARENGQGMAFPMPSAGGAAAGAPAPVAATAASVPPAAAEPPRPALLPAPAGRGPRLAKAEAASKPRASAPPPGDDDDTPEPPPAPKRPSLKRVK